MILMYLLFALTFSTVLTALISARIPQRREGEAFIGFFVALMMLAWAAYEWLIPALAVGLKTVLLPVLLLIIFGGILAASTILSVRPSGLLKQTVGSHYNKPDAEAIVFDLLLWVVVLTIGITVLRSLGV